jgi:cardiolipin synthase
MTEPVVLVAASFLRICRNDVSYQQERIVTIPTVITIIRLMLVPCVIFALIYGAWQSAFWFFCGAAISDGIDGFLARYLNQQTWFGALLDASVDKIMISACCIVLSYLGFIPLWFGMFIVVKEIFLVAGAGLLMYYAVNNYIRPTLLGKGALALQAFYISALLAHKAYDVFSGASLYYLQNMTIFFVVISLFQYMYRAMYEYLSKG